MKIKEFTEKLLCLHTEVGEVKELDLRIIASIPACTLFFIFKENKENPRFTYKVEINDIMNDVIKFHNNRHNRAKVTVNGKEYDVVLHTNKEEVGYWVECPELPGCDSKGDTREEALEMIKDAIDGYLQVVNEIY